MPTVAVWQDTVAPRKSIGSKPWHRGTVAVRNNDMNVLHMTTTVEDHTEGVTLCGIRVLTNRAAVEKAKQKPWVTCPLCELRHDLILSGREEMPGARRQSAYWQPSLFD